MQNMDNFTLAMTILLTGFIVVFAVLLLLIGIVKLYGTIVYNAETKAKQRKSAIQNQNVSNMMINPQGGAAVISTTNTNAISEEIIAVIAAAVDSIYGSGAQNRIKSIKKADTVRSNWSISGLIDNIKPF